MRGRGASLQRGPIAATCSRDSEGLRQPGQYTAAVDDARVHQVIPSAGPKHVNNEHCDAHMLQRPTSAERLATHARSLRSRRAEGRRGDDLHAGRLSQSVHPCIRQEACGGDRACHAHGTPE